MATDNLIKLVRPDGTPAPPPAPRPVILLGGGGHARALIGCLAMQGVPIAGILDPGLDVAGKVLGYPVLGGDEKIAGLSKDCSGMILAVGNPSMRKELLERCAREEVRVSTIFHLASVQALQEDIGAGVQVLTGAHVGPNSRLCNGALVNTHAVVEHDCQIGDYTHVAPGATICGGCTIGQEVLIGAGAIVLPNLKIGDRAIIAAGAVVSADVPADVTLHRDGSIIERTDK